MTTKQEKLEEQVVLSKEQFDAMAKDIALLKKSVSKSRLQEQEAKENKGKVHTPRGHLNRLDGQLVVKWMGVNEPGSKAESKILYSGTTPMGEVLKGHYITIDGGEIVTDAVRFYRSNDQEWFTKIGGDGDEWIVRFDNEDLPQEYKIHTKYINP